jgi:hypothetical protein
MITLNDRTGTIGHGTDPTVNYADNVRCGLLIQPRPFRPYVDVLQLQFTLMDLEVSALCSADSVRSVRPRRG